MFDLKLPCLQIILFFFSTSKYCCVAMLTGWRSVLETEPTGDSRVEALSSSAVAEDQRPTSPHTHSVILYITTVASVHSPFFISFDILLSSSFCIWKKKDENRTAETFFWEFIGSNWTGPVDGGPCTNLRDIIANPAALALRHRAEEGKAQGNASAELPLCVSVT